MVADFRGFQPILAAIRSDVRNHKAAYCAPVCIHKMSHLSRRCSGRGQKQEAERQLLQVEHQLEVASKAAADGTYGASMWEEVHRRQRDGLVEILKVHGDEKVPAGTLVHLGGR